MAKGRARTDLLLVATALLLLGVWFVLGRKPVSVDDSEPHPFAALENHPTKKLTVATSTKSITITRVDAPDAERRFLVQGSSTLPANEAAIDGFVHAISLLEVLRHVPEPRDMTRLGLSPPQLRITFTLQNEQVLLSLGHPSKVPDTGRYALVSVGGKERVVVLSPQATATLDVSPEQLIDHRFVDWIPSEVRQVTLNRNFERIAIRQLESGRFELSTLPHRRANRAKTEALLLSLTNLTVERYLDDKSAKNAVQRPTFTAILESNSEDNPDAITLNFGGACPGDPSTIVVSVTGPMPRLGCVKRELLDTFPQTEAELVDDQLFFLRTDETEKLTVQSTDGGFILERRGTAFRLVEPRSEEIALNTGNLLLGTLIAIHGTLLGPCDSRLVSDPIKLTLRSGIVGQKSFFNETLLVGPVLSSGERRVCRDDGQMLLVASDLAESLAIDQSLLRDPQLLNVPYESIDAVTVTLPQGLERLERDASGHLNLVEPKLPGDAASIESLTEQLAQLTVERWLPRARLTELRGLRPNIVVKFWSKKEDGNRVEHELRLFKSAERFTIAQLDNDDTPFVVTKTTVDLLDNLLVDRSMYRLMETDRAFSLSRGSQQIRCVKAANGFDCPSSSLTEATVTQLTETLTQLRAARVDAGTRQQQTGTLVVRIYETESASAKPRLTLTLHAPKSADEQRFWQASIVGQNLTTSYRADAIEPLLRPFATLHP